VTHWGGETTYHLSAPTFSPNGGDSPLRRLKMVHVKIPSSTAYYKFRRGARTGEDTTAAESPGWDAAHEKGIRSHRVTVYYVEPDVYRLQKDDLGDANLMAVLDPGGVFIAPTDKYPLQVSFKQIDDESAMTASVAETTPNLPPPYTTFSAAGTDGSWVNQDVSAILSPIAQAAPIAATYYGIDNAGCNESTLNCPIYADGLTVAGEGEHDLTCFSTDVTGQAEPAQHAIVRIDKTPPSTAASVGTAGGSVALKLVASDARSGVRQIDYRINGASQQTYQTPIAISAPGHHTF
jgi:hypothetical protein